MRHLEEGRPAGWPQRGKPALGFKTRTAVGRRTDESYPDCHYLEANLKLICILAITCESRCYCGYNNHKQLQDFGLGEFLACAAGEPLVTSYAPLWTRSQIGLWANQL